MKYLASVLMVVLASSSAFAAIDFSGVRALADRMGQTALTSKLSFEEIADKSVEKAQIVPNGDGATFTIKATSVHAASLAMGVYLRDVAKGHISWCGKRMPETWAVPTQTIDVQARYPMAMAYNYCTLSYTMAYWSKEAWQNEIDRLALSGYTTALCMAGVQKIWKLTMEELGYTKQQQQDFIVDDAQQAWWLMGNLQAQGNATPQGHYPIVSDEEIEKDAEIGKFIVKQMRAVGIEPVLQSFIGLVPSSTTKTQLVTYLTNHPEVCSKYEITDTDAAVKIFVTGSYNEGHKSPDLVDPNCTMFQVFSDVWNKNLKAAYGMDDEKDYPKFLGGDLFHENSPPASMTETEKNNCAKFVQKYQQDAFPGVTWVLQNWQSAPVQDLRNGLDPEHTIIQRLDQSMNATEARTASYVNYKMSPAGNIPWVWVEVMNFGGNTGMHGAFRRFRNVGNLGGNASFKGYGLLSEGLETNPVSYDMYHWAMVQSTQDQQNIDDDELEPWLDAYRQRRYGYTDDNLKAAHTILANTVWTCKQDQQGTMESVFCAKPAYNVTKVSAWGPTTGTPYDRKELIIAAEYFLETAKAHPELLDLETFRYDFVEIFQQVLADKAREMLPDCATSQKRRDEFRQMLVLLDSILACSNEWRLDAKEARLVGKAPTTGPAAYRRLITTWTPPQRHQTQLSQYAHRSYAGLVKNYYAKKWNAFFDVKEGMMSQAAYNALCDTLDEEFPTTELPATPTDGDPIAIAEEILALIAPPAITWTGATDNVWEHANWNDAKGQAAEWESGKSVILSGFNKTITTAGAITVGNISFTTDMTTPGNVYGGTNGGYITTDTDLGWTNLTLDELASAKYTGIMSGAWMGGAKLDCPAYHVKKDGDSVTMQFQVVHDSAGVYTKVVAVKLSINDAGHVIGNYLWSKNGKPETLGTEYTSSWTSANSDPNGYDNSVPKYGMIGISRFPASSVTVTGSVAVEGEITLNDGEALSLPGATAIDTLSLEKGTATLGLGATQDLAINVMLLGSDAKLILTGSAPTLMGAAGATKVKLPKAALSKIVYVGPDGEEQSLRLDTEGYLKAEFKATTISQWIPKSAISTGIKGLSLAELAEKGILSAKMDGGYVPTSDVNAYCGKLSDDGSSYTVQMQTIDGAFLKVVALEFTVVDGELKVEAKWIRNRSGDPLGTDCTNLSNYTNYGNPDVVTDTSSNGYGIYNLKITPAVARFADGTKFASITDALVAANGTQKVTLLDDVTVTTAINNSFKTWLEIPRGITLTATCGDFIWWDKAYTLDIYGMLDLGGNALSVGTTKSHVINLYAGGELKSTNAKGLAIFAANTTINVKANDGFDTATLNTPVQARENTTIAVEEGVTAVLNGNIVLKGGGESGTATPVVTKTGAGTLEFNGVITTGATLVLSEGTLKRVMSVGDTLVVTVDGGTTDITADNADAKVVETIDGAVHTFTCIERPYRYRVTDPGEISVNMPGTNYETLAEALDAARGLKLDNPMQVVNIWVLSQEVETLAQADLAAWNAANGTSMTLFGDGNGIVIKNWPQQTIKPDSVESYAAVKAIIGRLAGGYNEESVELGADTTVADAAMAKFEFVRDADLGQSAKVGPGTDGKILITAANAAGASFGLGQYLRNDAKVHISWCGNHVSDYTTWPVPASEKTYTPSAQLRMAYNYCTISYTMAFWNQRQWREELDRLALNGFNGALVMHGLGKVWKETLTDMGYTADEIAKFIPDAATWAWWNMGNIEGIGGPVSDAQLEQDAEMAKWMYGAMKEIGIEPLLQAFVGLVPSTSARAMAAKYPSNTNGSHYTLLGQGAYQGLTRPWVLHGANVASDATGDNYSLPAFDDFAASWYKHLAEVYDFETAGDPLYLGGDLFHEGGSTSGVNVTRYAKKIQSVQRQYYPGVKWILQHWGTNPSQAFVNNLDADHTIIERLDLDMNGSGASNSGWTNSSGKKFPWIWCEVMNFGGNTGMYGGVTRYRNLTKIGVGDSTFLGWGLLSEGLETNPMVYDIMMEQMHQPSDDTMDDSEFATFMDNYLVRRYGQKDTAVREAVQTLAETVLKTKRSQQGVLESVLCANPKKCPVTQVSSWGPSGAIEYDRTELYSVAEAYLEAARSASYKDLEVFKYDFAELFLQLISDRAREINGLTLTSKSARNEFRKLIDLAERLLASSERWRLDWHEGRTAGAADEAAAVRGYRRMVTTWVEHNNRGTGSLPEYAHRAYAGLIKDYYGKRWNLFFDKTEGTISESDYTAAINTLDSTFPTAKLTATAAGDLVAIGEEIMETLIPPAYAWTGAGNDGNWATAANWSFKEQATAYENGYDVTLPVAGATITASAPVTTGAITLGSASQDLAGLSATKTYNTAFIPATAGSIGWTGVTLADLLNGRYTGVMGGGWMGSNKNLACVGYFPTLSADGQTVTVQFHGFSESYTRCVAVEFTIVDGVVQAKAAWAKNASGDVCGLKNFKSTDSSANGSPSVATSDETAGYGLKAISLYPSTTLTLAGSITVGGALTIQAQEAVSFTGTEPTTLPEVVFANGGSLSAANVTTIESVSVEANGGILELGATQELEIGSVSTATGAYLILKGCHDFLAAGSVRLPREALANTRYIGPNGLVQELVMAADGSVKTKIPTQTIAGYVTTTYAETGWTGMTLADLKSCELTGNLQGGWMGSRSPSARGYYLTENNDGTISVQMQAQDVSDGSTWLKSVKLTFKEENGSIYVKSEWAHNKVTSTIPEDIENYTKNPNIPADSTGYGIYGLTVKPAVATVPAIKANYNSLDDAITAAKAQTDKNVSVIADTTYGTSRGLTGNVILTIEPDVKLTSTTGDGADWGGTCEVVVKGELDLAKTRWTFSSNNKLTLYTGATVKGVGDGQNGACAVEIHGNEHTIAVHKGDGETAVISSTIGLSNSVIFDVDADAKLEIGNTSGGNNGAAARTITKDGSGELAIVGSIYANATVILNAGTLTRKLAPEATFTMTVNGGTPNVVSTDEDYEIIDTAEGNVHTYTSTAIPWVFYVTPPGATTDAAAGGVKCRTLEEALSKRAEWGPTAKIWVIRGVDTTLPDGYELDDGSAGSEVIVPVPKLYFPAGVTDWTSSTKVATTKGGTATEAVKAGDVIRFANGSAMPSNSGNLYIANNVATKEMIVTDNTTLRLGSESSNKINLRDGWKVTIDEGSSLILRGWGNSNTAPTHLEGVVTLDGEGIVTIDASDAPTAVWDTVKGTATITIPAGVTVTVTGSIENPIAGAGTIKIAGDQQLTFAAGATVKVEAATSGFAYYAIESETENPDGTTTKIYRQVEIAKPAAFGKSWTNLYIGPETAGGSTAWNVVQNWAQINPASIARKTDGKAPYDYSTYTSALIDGELMSNVPVTDGYKKIVTTSALDGWSFVLGVTNGVEVTISDLSKFQENKTGVMGISVDATSKVIVETMNATGNCSRDIALHVAAENGIIFSGFKTGTEMQYFFEGDGSVSYTVASLEGAHVIKQVPAVDLGTGVYKKVLSRKLISCTPANTMNISAAEGAISATDETEMTAQESVSDEDEVGTYALRKGTDGIYLDVVVRSETPRHLTWNYAKTYWESTSGTDGNGNRGQAYLGDTLVDIRDTDVVDFPQSNNGCIYINKDLVPKMLIKRGATVTVGKADYASHIPAGAVIEIEEGGILKLSHWQGNCAAVIKDCTIKGAGKVIIDETKCVSLELGTVTGESKIETGTTPIKVSGADAEAKLVVSDTADKVEVTIPAEWVNKAYPTEAKNLTNTGANNLKIWESYVLGLDPTEETSVPVVAAKQTNDPNTFKLDIPNVAIRNDAGVTVTPKLMVGDSADGCTESDAQYDNGFTIPVPTGDTKVKYYKIKYEIK